jgi:hypothetical protein
MRKQQYKLLTKNVFFFIIQLKRRTRGVNVLVIIRDEKSWLKTFLNEESSKVAWELYI